jgi:hypothetical protein
LVVLPFIFVSFRESRLLVSWCRGGRCGTAGNDEDRGRSRRPIIEDQGWSHRSGTQWRRTIGRSGDAVCSLHRARGGDEREFLG